MDWDHVISTIVGADPCVCPDLGIVIEEGAHTGAPLRPMNPNIANPMPTNTPGDAGG
ncbi:MAG: hypothetical protein NTY51_07810 [Deltaproteobacteria bacterium]|nr:hypothetical protein [Deltaproteobacteria bacterium]